MILSCPACSTGFQIDDGHIGPDGRMVRCSVCKHTWKAEKAAEPIELKVAVKPKPETTEVLKEVKAKKLPSKYREIVEDQKRQKALTAQAYVWAALAASLLLVLGAAYLFRIDVVRTVPAFAGAYESVGLKVNGTNLEFESYAAESTFKGGRFVVTVKAKIRNLSDKPTPVPPVRARLYDASLGLFDTQTIGSKSLVIGPKATRTMVFDVTDPKNMTASIDLGFDLEALKHQSKSTKPHHEGKALGHGTKSEGDHGTDKAHVTNTHNSDTNQAHSTDHAAENHDAAQGLGAEHIVENAPPTALKSSAPLRGPLAAAEPVAETTGAGHSGAIKSNVHAEDHAIRAAH